MATNQSRADYWNSKYQKLDWNVGVHLGHFSNEKVKQSLAEATSDADSLLVREVMETCSVFRLVTGFRVLDFGCGSGTLGQMFIRRIMHCQYVGCDPSPSAISMAGLLDVEHEELRKEGSYCKFHCGGIDFLEQLAEDITNAKRFDLIIVREVFYLLSEPERHTLREITHRILRPGGFVYFADLFLTSEPSSEKFRKCLYERHQSLGSLLLTSDVDVDGIRGALTAAWGSEFVIRSASHSPTFIEASYRTAACSKNLDPENAKAYQQLAELAASGGTKGNARVTYIRAFLLDRSLAFSADSLSGHFSASLRAPIFNVLLPDVTYGFQCGKWNLLVGRSGEGKTTLLKALFHPGASRWGARTNPEPSGIFWLSQNHRMFDQLTALDNVAIFADTEEEASRCLLSLGLKQENVRRKIGDDFSGGELQKVALAQSLASRAALLVLDEPLKGLDKAFRMVLFESFREATSNDGSPRTVICVEHDFDSVKDYFDNIFELIAGFQFEMCLPDVANSHKEH